jgi:hypothetical protein
MGVRSALGRITGRYRTRVVVGVLVVSLPITVGLGLLLTRKASTSLTSTSGQAGGQLARAVALHVEDFVSERQESLALVGAQASAGLGDPAVAALAVRIDKTYGDFHVIEVTDLAGRVVVSSRPDRSFDPSGLSWFRTAAGGQLVVTSPVEAQGAVRWVLASPVLDAGGRPIGVVVADLDELVLSDLLNPEVDRASVVAVDADRHVVYDRGWRRVR